MYWNGKIPILPMCHVASPCRRTYIWPALQCHLKSISWHRVSLGLCLFLYNSRSDCVFLILDTSEWLSALSHDSYRTPVCSSPCRNRLDNATSWPKFKLPWHFDFIWLQQTCQISLCSRVAVSCMRQALFQNSITRPCCLDGQWRSFI